MTPDSQDDERLSTHHGLMAIRGIGKQVKKTVPSRKGFLPHTSDRAPMSGALRKESRPWGRTQKQSQSSHPILHFLNAFLKAVVHFLAPNRIT